MFRLVYLFDPLMLLASFKSYSVFVKLSFTQEFPAWCLVFLATYDCASILFIHTCCLYSINVYINYIKLHVSVALDRACYQALAAMKMCLQSTPCHYKHYQTYCVFLVLVQCFFFCLPQCLEMTGNNLLVCSD